MKSGKHIILGQIDQEQTKQFFHPARGVENDKLLDTMIDHGMIRYNSTIDRLEGVVRSIDSNGRAHPGRWSPFTTVNDLGVCDPDAADVFAAYIGTVLNSAEISKPLFINITGTRGTGGGGYNSYPTGNFLGGGSSKDPTDTALVISTGTNITNISTAPDENLPTINLTVPAWGGEGWFDSNVNANIPGSLVTMTLDLFNYFDIPTDERPFFYITPYMCLNSVVFTPSDARPHSGNHVYNLGGVKGNIQPLTRDPTSSDFGKFILTFQVRSHTDLANFSLYLTANRFDNFIPTCDNPLPPAPPPPIPDPVVIHCRPDSYNAGTRINCNIRQRVEQEYWQWIGQPINVRVEVHEGAEVHGRRWDHGTYGLPAIDARNMPNNSTIVINNRGKIVGGGGIGGMGQGYTTDATGSVLKDPEAGGQGDIGISGDTVELTINNLNTGEIIHGSGGGGGAWGYTTFAGDMMAGGNGGGGVSYGGGGSPVMGHGELDHMNTITPTKHDGMSGELNAGAGGIPNWNSSEQYRLWNNDALVIGYGVFTRYDSQGAAGATSTLPAVGGSFTSGDAPAQGVFLLNNLVPAEDDTLTIGQEEFTFKTCPTDTRTCWDGTVLNRDPDDNCNFPVCPNLPIVDYVRNRDTEQPLFQTNYRLLEYASGDTVVGGELRIRFDSVNPINFPDPANVEITLSISNEKHDSFEVDTGAGYGKSATISWNVTNNGFTVESTFNIRAKDLVDAGDPDTILDGSPYYADLKLEMLGFSNTTVAQLELNVLKPTSTLAATVPDNSVEYEQTPDDGNVWWNANQTIPFSLLGNAIKPDGVVIDCDTGAFSIRDLSAGGLGGIGILPQTLLANEPSVAGMPVDERINYPNLDIVPWDYVDSYAEFDRNTAGGARVVGTNAGHAKTGMEMLVECWVRIRDDGRDAARSEIIFNKENCYEMGAFVRTNGTFSLRVAINPNNAAGNGWAWKDTGFVGNLGQTYHVGLLLRNQGDPRDVVFVDGVQVWSEDHPAMTNNTNQLNIGCRSNDPGASIEQISADITEFRIWHSDGTTALNTLFTTYRDTWSRRLFNGVLGAATNIPGVTVGVYHHLTTANTAGCTATTEYTAVNKDLMDFDMNRPGLMPDPIATGVTNHIINLTYTDNADDTQNTISFPIQITKSIPFTISLSDRDGNQPIPTDVSKMFSTTLNQVDAVIRVRGTGMAAGTPLIVNGSAIAGQAITLETRPHADDTNGLNNPWAVTNNYALADGPYDLLLEVRIQNSANNDLLGIGDDFAAQLDFNWDGDLQAQHDMLADITPGILLTKTFTAADAGYIINNAMVINRVSNLLQKGANGLGTTSEFTFTLTGGAGGGGAVNPGVMNGGTGLEGNILTDTTQVADTDRLEIRVGTGGGAGVSVPGIANGGLTGGLANGNAARTGGNSAYAGSVDSEGHVNEYRSGGGGGGYTQMIHENQNQTVEIANMIAGGGSGGSGAYVLANDCDGNYANPIPGQGCVFTAGCAILDFNGDPLQDFATGDEITIGDPRRVGQTQGANGVLSEPHNRSPIVGVSGGGGGGRVAGIAGWCGSDGDISTQRTTAGLGGGDGDVTVQFRAYTNNADDVISLAAIAGQIGMPPALAGVFDATTMSQDQLPFVVPSNTPFRVLARRPVNWDGLNRDPESAWYNNQGDLLNENDDFGSGHPDHRLLPGYSFRAGLAPNTYWMVLSRYNTIYADNFVFTGNQPIIDFNIDIQFEQLDNQGNPTGNILGTYSHVQDATTRHVLCACQLG